MARAQDPWTQSVLLGMLVSGPRHGYELYQELEQDLGGVWRIGLSQLYAQLKQLEEAGLVVAETAPQANRPSRKVFQLTGEGRDVFLHWVRQPSPNLRLIRVEFLLRLYLLDRLSLPGVEELVAAQRAVCREQAGRYAQEAGAAAAGFPQLVYAFRQGQMEAAIRWLDGCQAVLSGRPPAAQSGESAPMESPERPPSPRHDGGAL